MPEGRTSFSSAGTQLSGRCFRFFTCFPKAIGENVRLGLQEGLVCVIFGAEAGGYDVSSGAKLSGCAEHGYRKQGQARPATRWSIGSGMIPAASGRAGGCIFPDDQCQDRPSVGGRQGKDSSWERPGRDFCTQRPAGHPSSRASTGEGYRERSNLPPAARHRMAAGSRFSKLAVSMKGRQRGTVI